MPRQPSGLTLVTKIEYSDDTTKEPLKIPVHLRGGDLLTGKTFVAKVPSLGIALEHSDIALLEQRLREQIHGALHAVWTEHFLVTLKSRGEQLPPDQFGKETCVTAQRVWLAEINGAKMHRVGDDPTEKKGYPPTGNFPAINTHAFLTRDAAGWSDLLLAHVNAMTKAQESLSQSLQAQDLEHPRDPAAP